MSILEMRNAPPRRKVRKRVWSRARLSRDPYHHPADPMDEIGINPFRFLDQFDRREALHDLFPKRDELHFRQAIADATMHAEAERQVMSGPRPVDDEFIRMV